MNFDDPRNFDYKPRTSGRAPFMGVLELLGETLQFVLLLILVLAPLFLF